MLSQIACKWDICNFISPWILVGKVTLSAKFIFQRFQIRLKWFRNVNQSAISVRKESEVLIECTISNIKTNIIIAGHAEGLVYINFASYRTRRPVTHTVKVRIHVYCLASRVGRCSRFGEFALIYMMILYSWNWTWFDLPIPHQLPSPLHMINNKEKKAMCLYKAVKSDGFLRFFPLKFKIPLSAPIFFQENFNAGMVPPRHACLGRHVGEHNRPMYE